MANKEQIYQASIERARRLEAEKKLRQVRVSK